MREVFVTSDTHPLMSLVTVAVANVTHDISLSIDAFLNGLVSMDRC